MELATTRRGLTGFQLKYLALGLMLMDHIHYFFSFTGAIPEWFSMLGRLSAPLFLFTMVEGFAHTHDRKAYFLRIYAISTGMGILQYLFSCVGPLQRADGFTPANSIFQNYVILIVLLQGIDWCRARQWKKGVPAILFPIALPYAVIGAYLLSGQNKTVGLVCNLLHYSVLPLWSWIYDGGFIYILEGVLLYLMRGNRKLQAFTFFVVNFLFYGVWTYYLIPGAAMAQMFTTYYEWLGSFAAIFMLLYNGQKGHGSKKLFYIFYPAHVYLLYGLSCIVCQALH
jgi:hypothetical protein